ncbi:hypothetical protein BSK56_25915 [Paenibacillus borealis]|uniref:NADP-dependent oxidoreductase domain-containing protein n=2 Tax=Paenibacillus TaxID=44249 RepID=A0ABX3H0E4_PAEBO|nr:hypothetical protein BSK56_25915 [Paenibacillus borealis]
MSEAIDSRRLGDSGLKISVLGLGTWLNFSTYEDNLPMVAAALERGICHFDTADMYGALPGWSETLLGNTLKGYTRSAYVLSTKVHARVGKWPNDAGLSRKHITESCHKSLTRLQTDYIDIYYCHRFDPDTPLYETVDALATLKNQGKILYAGISMWPADQIKEFTRLAKQANLQVVANQVLYNTIQRPSREEIQVCREEGIGLVAYSPLAQGLLSGKYKGESAEGARGKIPSRNKWIKRITDNPDKVKALKEYFQLCDAYEVPYVQAAMGWVLAQDLVSCALSGFRNMDQLQDALSAYPYTLPPELIQGINLLEEIWLDAETASI